MSTDNTNQMQAAPTTTSDVPNQLPEPDQQSPSLFAQLMANSVNNSGQQPSQQPGQTLPPQTQPPTSEQVQQTKDAALETHPANQKAKLLYKIGETLAGGPQIKTTYHEDGSVTREKVPLTTKQVITGALANILGSVGQVSDNLSARMQGRAPKPIAPLPTQQAAAAQAQQADSDFERQQLQRVRQARVINANLEGLRAAYALSMEDDEAKKQAVANHADDLANWQKSGAVEATNIPSDELLQRGFDKSKYIFIPDGIVPATKPDGTRATNAQGVPLSITTYSVVDGTTQAKLSQDKYDQFAKYGLMQAREGFRLPEGATISSAQLALMNNKLSLIFQTQRELDRLHDAVGGDKVDLATEIKKNPKLVSAIEQFHNTNAGEDDPVKLLQAMAASNNPKVKGAVGTMAALFGQQNLDKWLARTQTASDLTEDKARSIISDPRTDKNSPAYQKAVAFLSGKRQEKRDAKQDELNAQRAIENEDLDAAAKNIVSGNVAQIKDLASFRGDQKTRLYNLISQEATAAGKNPKDYSPAMLEAKSKVLNDFADGKAADSIVAFNTFLGHADDAMSATAAMRGQAGSPLINRPVNWLRKNAANDTNFKAFQTALEPVKKEFQSFLNNNRAEHEADLKTMDKILSDDSTPAQVESALKQLGKSADIRLRELGRKYSNTIGEEYPNLIAPEGQQALRRMGIQSSLVNTAPSTQTVPKPATTQPNQTGGFDWNTAPKVAQ